MTIGLPNKKTFCPAPWFQIRNRNDLTKSACCRMYWTSNDPQSKFQEPLEALNSQTYINIRENLHKGIEDSNCKRCWQDEKIGLQSLRQKYNFLLEEADKDFIKNYFKDKKDFITDTILSADIKMGNTCNYACVMCFPSASSLVYNKWAKDPNNEFVQEQLKLDPLFLEKMKKYTFKNKMYLDYIKSVVEKNSNLMYLKLLGGEPLMAVKVLDYLSNLEEERKNKITLQFTTNGSQDIVPVLKKLGNFKGINIVISLEGVGDIQEYARWGSDWEEQQKHILSLQKYIKEVTHVNMGIQHVFQTITVNGFKNLVNWCVENNLSMGFLTTLVEPYYLSLKTLPDTLRDNIIKVLENSNFKIDRKLYRNEDEEQTFTKEQLIGILKGIKFDPKLYQRFLRYIEWYEQGKKNIKPLKEIYPELFIDVQKSKKSFIPL